MADDYSTPRVTRMRKCRSGDHSDCIIGRTCLEGRRLWFERQERAEIKAFHDLHGIPDDWPGEVDAVHTMRADLHDTEDEIHAYWPQVRH